MTDRYAGSAEISLTNITKNNGVTLDGLVFNEKDEVLSPTIYLDGYYDMLNSGHSYDEVFNIIADTYEKNRCRSGQIEKNFNDFSWVKEHLVMRLIGREQNRETLSNTPFIPFLDMALVFAVRLQVKSGIFGSALVRSDHAKSWETDASELFASAKKNAKKLLPPVCRKLSDILAESSPESLIALDGVDIPMHVLSNTEKSYGASVICYHGVVRELSDKLDDDLFIIPSSVHEVIAFPVSTGMDLDSLNETIRSVNTTQLAPTDVLSDHAYIYHRDSDRITY